MGGAPPYWASVERTPWGRAKVGATMACLEGETIDRIAALIESSRALSGVLTLVLASTPPGELSAIEIDALTDLSYKIHLNLDQLDEIWVQVGDEYRKAATGAAWRTR